MDAPVPGPGALSPDGVWRWDGTSWIPSDAIPPRQYRDPGVRPMLAMAGLLLAGLCHAILLGALTGRLDLANRLIAGTPVTIDDAVHSDNVVSTAATVSILGGLVCAVVFLVWLHRVAANNVALGAQGLRFKPGEAVLWWFVPIANWVMSFRVMAEAWRGCDPAQPRSTGGQRAAMPLPVVLVAWWATLVLGSLVAAIANFARPSQATDIAGLRAQTVVFMIASATLAASAVLGALTVNRLSARQRALREAATAG